MGFQVSVDYMDYYDDNNDLRTGYDDINFLYTYNDKHCFGYQIPASLEIKIFL